MKVANDDAAGDTGNVVDPRLEAIVNRMFQRFDNYNILTQLHVLFGMDLYVFVSRCFDDRQFKQAIGIALETRRIDVFREAILKSVEHCSNSCNL